MMAGVTASAGAQIDLTFLTVGRRATVVSLGKFSSTYFHFGFSTTTSFTPAGSVTKSSLETAGNTSHVLLQIQHISHIGAGAVGLNFQLQGTVADTDVGGFKTLVMTNTSTGQESKLSRSARYAYGTPGSKWTWSYASNLLSNAYNNGQLLAVELRSDDGV